MTKSLDPEIKSLRRLDRALQTVPPDARQRVLEWLVARECRKGWVRLPPVKPKANAAGSSTSSGEGADRG